MPDDLADQTIALYRSLAAARAHGGGRGLPAFRPDHWDLRIDGILVEFDEERHFNRYRAQTLRAAAYERLTTFPLVTYRAFCTDHERDCLASASHGGYWSNQSCEAMFGPPGRKGDLSGLGAPRWKQRAFYDHLKDLAPLCGLGPMVRLAVWDELPDTDGVVLGHALDGQELERPIGAVMRLIEERVSPD